MSHLQHFIEEAQYRIQQEYERIQARRTTDRLGRERLEDPGTAGDQAESNWANLLREWLPAVFTVATKGRIIFPNGETSPQVDVVILSPYYPRFLLEREDKYYLSSGVVAAFECKLTGSRKHLGHVFETASFLGSRARQKGPSEMHRQLNSGIPFGYLCHKFDGTAEAISGSLFGHLKNTVHPREIPSFFCAANIACWGAMLMVMTTGPVTGVYATYKCPQGYSEQEAPNAVGRFVVSLYNRLALDFPEMTNMALDLTGLGTNPYQVESSLAMGAMKSWNIKSVVDARVLEDEERRYGKIRSIMFL